MKFSLFKYGTGILYGTTLALDSISPDTGPSTGGQAFVIRGETLYYPTYDSEFTGVVLDPSKWTDISSGTGSATTGSSHLQLSSGTTTGSVGGIQMIASHTDVQYEAKINIPSVTVNPTADVILFEMQNYVDANNQANFYVKLDSSGNVTLNSDVYLGGTLKDTYSETWTTGVSTLKILRWSTDVYFYANGSLFYYSKQGNTSSAAFRFFVGNLTTTYNVYNTVVEYVKNRPYAAFDNQVVHDLTVVSDSRARGFTPPSMDGRGRSAAYEGLVDVSVVSNATLTVTDMYEYYYVDSLTLVDEEQFDFKFSAIDDDSVKTPAASSRGLGGR